MKNKQLKIPGRWQQRPRHVTVTCCYVTITTVSHFYLRFKPTSVTVSTSNGLHIFQKSNGQHYTLDARRVTKRRTILSDLWTSPLSVAVCSVRVNWHTFKCEGGKGETLQLLCWKYQEPPYNIWCTRLPRVRNLCDAAHDDSNCRHD